MRNVPGLLRAVPVLTLLLYGCAQPATEPAPQATATLPAATLPPEPTPTITPIPSPTPLPGSVVLPIDTMSKTIPWLPLDKEALPGTYYFWFNVLNPPFNSELVRQAFAAATDREALTEIARKYGKKEAMPATSFTPPQTLGRDLYNEVGIRYDPERARALLAQAGYDDPSKFPAFTLLTNATGDPAPAAHQQIAEAMVRMWKETLGVTATLEVITWSAFMPRIESDPPALFRLGWAADVNDPDNFLREVFHSGSQYNHGNFLSTEFDDLVDRARKSSDPQVRQALYIEAERILCEIEVGVIPIYHATYR